mmetsp:Transcript_11298/g.31256  ORF Transcript_11298/g.31256 Transcript_11298/m.31256 type:complete len:85 (-) Transcript_11298:787-1041(-)|eukprot:CAMPEP_0198135098 /NCGR_PEP_ID=MMETSP1442-20131203/60414_1 /TAXON_ID= /ORGANISM="Craspedostauros australis, Strain CCMP3328" /LENGTH=84 /DNA_ID=CAMNT_0043796259 /DNA_START=932 /DNA_END=1186 /DNA_ORIENTATION=+
MTQDGSSESSGTDSLATVKRVSITGSVIVGDNAKREGGANEPSAVYKAALGKITSPKRDPKNSVLASMVSDFPFEDEMERRMSQ